MLKPVRWVFRPLVEPRVRWVFRLEPSMATGTLVLPPGAMPPLPSPPPSDAADGDPPAPPEEPKPGT